MTRVVAAPGQPGAAGIFLSRGFQLSNRRQSSSGGSQSHRPRSGSSPMMGGGNGGGRTDSHITMMDG